MIASFFYIFISFLFEHTICFFLMFFFLQSFILFFTNKKKENVYLTLFCFFIIYLYFNESFTYFLFTLTRKIDTFLFFCFVIHIVIAIVVLGAPKLVTFFPPSGPAAGKDGGERML